MPGDLERAIQRIVRRHKLISAVACVARHDQVLWQGEWGRSVAATCTKAKANTVYATASLMKPLVATALLMQLHANDVLDSSDSVDSTVRKILKLGANSDLTEVSFRDVLAWRVKIEFRHVDQSPLLWDNPLGKSLRRELSKRWMRKYPSGGVEPFGNLAYQLAGLLASHLAANSLSQEGLDETLRALVLDRLRMNDTRVSPSAGMVERMALPYSWDINGWTPSRQSRFRHRAAAEGYTTVNDMVRFLAVLVDPERCGVRAGFPAEVTRAVRAIIPGALSGGAFYFTGSRPHYRALAAAHVPSGLTFTFFTNSFPNKEAGFWTSVRGAARAVFKGDGGPDMPAHVGPLLGNTPPTGVYVGIATLAEITRDEHTYSLEMGENEWRIDVSTDSTQEWDLRDYYDPDRLVGRLKSAVVGATRTISLQVLDGVEKSQVAVEVPPLSGATAEPLGVEPSELEGSYLGYVAREEGQSPIRVRIFGEAPEFRVELRGTGESASPPIILRRLFLALGANIVVASEVHLGRRFTMLGFAQDSVIAGIWKDDALERPFVVARNPRLIPRGIAKGRYAGEVVRGLMRERVDLEVAGKTVTVSAPALGIQGEFPAFGGRTTRMEVDGTEALSPFYLELGGFGHLTEGELRTGSTSWRVHAVRAKD